MPVEEPGNRGARLTSVLAGIGLAGVTERLRGSTALEGPGRSHATRAPFPTRRSNPRSKRAELLDTGPEREDEQGRAARSR